VLAVEVRDSGVGSGALPLFAAEVVFVDVEAAEDLEALEEAFVAAAALDVVEAEEEDFFEAELDLAFDDVDEETDSVLACFRADVVAGSGLARLAAEVDAAGAGEGDDVDVCAVDCEVVAAVDVRSFEELIASEPIDRSQSRSGGGMTKRAHTIQGRRDGG
jgi:hypothetical protein